LLQRRTGEHYATLWKRFQDYQIDFNLCSFFQQFVQSSTPKLCYTAPMKEILNEQAHRPWPLPPGPWTMTQQWCDLLFAHWPVPIETMRALVPPQLKLDTWDGMAWIGVVPFRMQGVRPRWLPAVPWLSAFAELNVRTYVKVCDRGLEKPGVYFFSLEAANPVAVALARGLFLLPYFNAKMGLLDDGKRIHYASRRTHRHAPAAEFVGSYAPNGPIYHAAPGSFDAWLTERYALYTTGLLPVSGLTSGEAQAGNPIYIGEIHHVRWPLQLATASIERNNMTAVSGIALPDQPPVLHFARQIEMVVWPLRKIETA
jgi:uncharacterized protein YqjF (DUF2071 family)